MTYVRDEKKTKHKKNNLVLPLSSSAEESIGLSVEYINDNAGGDLNQQDNVAILLGKLHEKEKTGVSEGIVDSLHSGAESDNYARDMIMDIFYRLATDVTNQVFSSMFSELKSFKSVYEEIECIYKGNFTLKGKFNQVVIVLEDFVQKGKRGEAGEAYNHVRDYLNSLVPILRKISDYLNKIQSIYDNILGDEPVLVKLIALFGLFEQIISIPKVSEMGVERVKPLLVKLKQLFILIQTVQNLPEDAGIKDYMSAFKYDDFILDMVGKSTIELGEALGAMHQLAKRNTPFPRGQDVITQIQWLAKILSDPQNHDEIRLHLMARDVDEEKVNQIFSLFQAVSHPGEVIIREFKSFIPLHFIENTEGVAFFERLINLDWSSKPSVSTIFSLLTDIFKISAPMALPKIAIVAGNHYLPQQVSEEIIKICNDYNRKDSWGDAWRKVGERFLNMFVGEDRELGNILLNGRWIPLLGLFSIDPISSLTIKYANDISKCTNIDMTLRWFLEHDTSKDQQINYYYTLYLQAMLSKEIYQYLNADSDEEMEEGLRNLAAKLKNSHIVQAYPQLEIFLELLPLLPALRKAKNIVGKQEPANNLLDWINRWLNALANSDSLAMAELREKLYKNTVSLLSAAISSSISALPSILTFPSAAAAPVPVAGRRPVSQEVTEADFNAMGQQEDENAQPASVADENSGADEIMEITTRDLEFLYRDTTGNTSKNNVATTYVLGPLSGIIVAAALADFLKIKQSRRYARIRQNDDEATNEDGIRPLAPDGNKSLYQYWRPALLLFIGSAGLTTSAYKYYFSGNGEALTEEERNRIDDIVAKIDNADDEASDPADSAHSRRRRSTGEASVPTSTDSPVTDIPVELLERLDFNSYSAEVSYIVIEIIKKIIRRIIKKNQNTNLEGKIEISYWNFYSRVYKNILAYLKKEKESQQPYKDDEGLLDVARECVANMLNISQRNSSKELRWEASDSEKTLFDEAVDDLNFSNLTAGMESYFSSLSENEWRQLYNGVVPDDGFRAISFSTTGNIHAYDLFTYALGLAVNAKHSNLDSIKTNWHVAFSYYEKLNLKSNEDSRSIGLSPGDVEDMSEVYSDLICFRFIFESILRIPQFVSGGADEFRIAFSKDNFIEKMKSPLHESFKSIKWEVAEDNQIEVESNLADYYMIDAGILKDSGSNSQFQRAMNIFKIEEEVKLKEPTSTSDLLERYNYCINAIRVKHCSAARRLKEKASQSIIFNPILKQDVEIAKTVEDICNYYVGKQDDLVRVTSRKENYNTDDLLNLGAVNRDNYFKLIAIALAYTYDKALIEYINDRVSVNVLYLNPDDAKERETNYYAELYRKFTQETAIFSKPGAQSGDNDKLLSFQYAMFVLASGSSISMISWDMLVRNAYNNKSLMENNVTLLDKAKEVKGFNKSKKYNTIKDILPYSDFDPQAEDREKQNIERHKFLKDHCRRVNLSPPRMRGGPVISACMSSISELLDSISHKEESGDSTIRGCTSIPIQHLMKKRQIDLEENFNPISDPTGNENDSPEFKYNKQFYQYKEDGSIDVEAIDSANKIILQYYNNDPWLFELKLKKPLVIIYKMEYFVEGKTKGKGEWKPLPGRVYVFHDYKDQTKAFSTVMGMYQLLNDNETFDYLYKNVGDFEPCGVLEIESGRTRRVESSSSELGFAFSAPNNSKVGFVYDKEITEHSKLNSLLWFGIKEDLTERVDILKKIHQPPEDMSFSSLFTSLIPFYDIIQNMRNDPGYTPDFGDILLESINLALLAVSGFGMANVLTKSATSLFDIVKAMTRAGVPRRKIIQTLTNKIAVATVEASGQILQEIIENIILDGVPFTDISKRAFFKMTKANKPVKNQLKRLKVSNILDDVSTISSTYSDFADIIKTETLSSEMAQALFTTTPFTISELSGESSGPKRIVYNLLEVTVTGEGDKKGREVVSIKPAACDDENTTMIYFIKRGDDLVIPKQPEILSPSNIYFEDSEKQYVHIENIDEHSIRIYNSVSENIEYDITGELLKTEPLNTGHAIDKRAIERRNSFSRMSYHQGGWQIDTQKTTGSLRISQSKLKNAGHGLGVTHIESKTIPNLLPREYTVNVDASWRVIDRNNTFTLSNKGNQDQGIYSDGSNNHYLKVETAYYRVIRDDALDSWVMVGPEKQGKSLSIKGTGKKSVPVEKRYTYYEGRSIPVRYNNGTWYYNDKVPDGRFGYDNYKMKKLEWLGIEANRAFDNFKAISKVDSIARNKSISIENLTKELIENSMPSLLKKQAAHAGVINISDEVNIKLLKGFVNIEGSLSQKKLFPGIELSDATTLKNFTFEKALGKNFKDLSVQARKQKLEEIRYSPDKVGGEKLRYKVSDVEAYMKEVHRLYTKSENPMHAEIDKRIRDFLKNNDYELSVFDGLPGLHAEVQALNAMINELNKSKGGSFNLSDALSNTHIFTRRLVGKLNQEFPACYNCSGILSGLEKVPTRKVDVNLKFSK
ncbi:YwqJ-related putative deaminase [Serratia sp. 2723]|uniref:YwqJ-related putative deaminase n=1 Tax=unclassified Serratia (in: enterobacteria) TaxID=2647522 RepID=UPI003D1EF0CA